MTGWITAYIGLGSNIGDSAAQVRAGMQALRDLELTRDVRCSSLYRSAPVGITDQPDFINAVCVCATRLPAAALMEQLLAIERRHGRERSGAKGGPRTLDLDLLLYGDHISEAPTLSLPHPRLHERAFVLYPLAELAPALIVPGRGALGALLRACPPQRLEKLTP